jgi:adenylate cyclase class 2
MVELKARVNTLDPIRRKIIDLKAHHVGAFNQVDVYFEVPEGRLKLREVEGKNTVELVYYKRENVAGPKRSEVFILEVQKPAAFKTLLEKVLETGVTVEKLREVYRYQGTQIHLDNIKKLGVFVEFERETPADIQAIRKNQQALEGLMKKLGIKPQNLEKMSYSNLIQKCNQK